MINALNNFLLCGRILEKYSARMNELIKRYFLPTPTIFFKPIFFSSFFLLAYVLWSFPGAPVPFHFILFPNLSGFCVEIFFSWICRLWSCIRRTKSKWAFFTCHGQRVCFLHVALLRSTYDRDTSYFWFVPYFLVSSVITSVSFNSSLQLPALFSSLSLIVTTKISLFDWLLSSDQRYLIFFSNLPVVVRHSASVTGDCWNGRSVCPLLL